MGRNKGSRTGVVVTYPAICQQCGREFRVLGKRRQDGPRPAMYCRLACYHVSQKGKKNPLFKGGAPKGRIPWNKGKTCPQLTGKRNGMYGRIHTPETRALLSRLSSSQLSELTRQRMTGTQAPLARSDPKYPRLFRLGWRSIRKIALDRDGNACVVCGAQKLRMEVHHIVPFSIVLRHDLDNLVTLCGSCHTRVHRGALQLAG